MKRLFGDWLMIALLACLWGCIIAATVKVREPAVPLRPATERIAVEQIGTALPGPLTPDERYAAVTAAIGPPPSDDAVPVMGYTTRNGVTYPPRWRTRPDAEKANNLKQ